LNRYKNFPVNKFAFSKYQGAGNDFVMLDNRNGEFNSLSTSDIAAICHRKYGIGADGLILLEYGVDGVDITDGVCGGVDTQRLQMRYYNADGSIASFCGNGGRCFALFAHHLGLSKQCRNITLVTFIAGDGRHEAAIYSEKRIQISMRSVKSINMRNSCGNTLTVLDTGVPHGVVFTQSLDTCNVVEDGRKIRNDKQFSEGINVDFVECINSDSIRLRTYERGVENETDSCGTGAVAAAIAAVIAGDRNVYGNAEDTAGNAGRIGGDKEYLDKSGAYEINVETKTARLKIYFTLNNDNAKGIILEGPAIKVFEGSVAIMDERTGTMPL
jgi:diaminopimelate epimerase